MKSFNGIWTLFKREIDCKAVEIPPKLMTIVANTVAIFIFGREAISVQPFVISIRPKIVLFGARGNGLIIIEINSVIIIAQLPNYVK